MAQKEIDAIRLATYESKELERIRNSTSFKIGVVVTNLIKRPWRIILLPFDIIKAFNSKNLKPFKLPTDGCLFIGVDTKGTYHSDLATTLHHLLDSPSKKIHILTTPISKDIGKRHSIIQSPRSMVVSDPKAWNLMVERMLATMILSNHIGKIVLVTDYPFKGITNVLKDLINVKCCWIKSPLPIELEKQIEKEKGIFDNIIDADEILLSLDQEEREKLPLARKGGVKNVIINLPNKDQSMTRVEVLKIRQLIDEKYNALIYQVGYGSDDIKERELPGDYIDNIDWKTIDLLITDGSIESWKRIEDSDCHVICLPDQKMKRSNQIQRSREKGLFADVTILVDPHFIALEESLHSLLVIRPNSGMHRRNERVINSNASSPLHLLKGWLD